MSVSPLPRLPSGVFVRSQRPLPSSRSQTQQAKLSAILAEFEIPERPHMPTKAVWAAHEEVRISLIQLLELKRQSERLDQEIRIAETRLHGGAAAEKGRKRKNTTDRIEIPENIKKRQ
jgi:DNA methyltransferase 1-associated protein 1